eukprot:7615174-Heterocapsa_arctica.AAC.1
MNSPLLLPLQYRQDWLSLAFGPKGFLKKQGSVCVMMGRAPLMTPLKAASACSYCASVPHDLKGSLARSSTRPTAEVVIKSCPSAAEWRLAGLMNSGWSWLVLNISSGN